MIRPLAWHEEDGIFYKITKFGIFKVSENEYRKLVANAQ